MSKTVVVGIGIAFIVGVTYPTYLLSQVRQEIIVSRDVRVHTMQLHDAIEGVGKHLDELGKKVKIETDALETVMTYLKEQYGKHDDVMTAITTLTKDVLVAIQPEPQHRLEIAHRVERLEVGMAARIW